MAWCLVKSESDNFKQALKDGTVDPFKLVQMTSAERNTFFSTVVSKENAQQINSLFESKLLLKNQQKGYQTWAKRVAGLTPQTKRDILSRIERLDAVLDPKAEEAFLQDLASTRLKIDVTQEEAKTISDLSNKLVSLKSKAKEDGTFDSNSDRLRYGMAKVNIERYINDLKLDAKSISFREQKTKKIKSIIGQAPGAMKSAVASLDNSFWGRQGIKTLLDVRTSNIWFKNFLKSFKDIGKQLTAEGKWYTSGEDAALDAIKADIYSRPNALNGKYDAGNYGLGVLSEEEFPSSLPERIPVLGRLFKASEAAYNGGALRLRADLADRLIRVAEKQGIDTLDKGQAEGMGRLISSLTGRGSLGKGEVLAKEANVLLFSIKFLKGNIDTLTAHRFDSKATPFTKKEAAKNLLSITASIASVLTLAKMIDPESVDEDPRSTNFGKVKVFGRWTDITGGMASLVTLASRTMVPTKRNGVWGLWNKSSTGKWTNLTKGGFGARTALDVFESFWEGKLAPVAGIVRDVWRGRNFQGDRPTIENILENSLTPISVQNFNQLKDDPDTSSVFGSMLLELGGLSISTYKPKTNWETSTSKELKQFKEQVGADEFKRANEDFNRAYNDWFSTVTQLDEYKELSEDDKDSLKASSKIKIKKQVFDEYGFKKPKKETKTQKQKDKEKEIEKLKPISHLIEGANNILSKLNLIPEAKAAAESEILSLKVEGDTVTTTFKDEEGRFVERFASIDEDIGIIGKTIGKFFDSAGKALGFDELGISEAFKYEDKEKRIERLLEVNDIITAEVQKTISPEPTKKPKATPTPVPQPPLTDRAEKTTVQHTDLVTRHFPADQINNALNVMAGESSGSTRAFNENSNGSADYGLMQINSIHKDVIKNNFGYTMNDMFDPEKNIEVARFLYDQSVKQNGNGWVPWVAAKGIGLVN